MNLGGTNFEALSRTYHITVIQDPERGSVMGPPLSRIPLAPVLIIQLDTWDKDDNLIIPYEDLPFLLCHIVLETPAGEPADGLYGTTLVAAAEMDDREGAPGIYFVFPDVSVRFAGQFRLKGYIMRITGGPSLDTCYTQTFEVVEASQFVAPPITELTRHFMEQGAVHFRQPIQGDDWFATS